MIDTVPYRDHMSLTTLPAHTLPAHTGPSLDDLAHLIATNGIERYESDIARLVVRLRADGVDLVLTDLLADPSAPGIARERAYGVLVGQLARGPAERTAVLGAAA
jgi:hypothetical protein